MIDSSATEHFRQGREALVRQRAELDDAITAVDRILATFSGGEEGLAPQRSVRTRASGNAAGAAAVLEALKPHGTSPVWTPAAIHEQLLQSGVTWEYATTRSTVAKMGRDGSLLKISRGRYQLPANAESAAVTALSEVRTTDPQEGGDGDGTGDHRDHDPDQGHRDHSGSAPAVAAGY